MVSRVTYITERTARIYRIEQLYYRTPVSSPIYIAIPLLGRVFVDKLLKIKAL